MPQIQRRRGIKACTIDVLHRTEVLRCPWELQDNGGHPQVLVAVGYHSVMAWTRLVEP